ncbi:MAG: diguanylate cyclase, partial [Candidatus Omnitrophota bacterium]
MDLNNKSAEKLADEIKFLQIRITELEKSKAHHRSADELLRRTELQQKAILNNIPDIAWLKDKDSRFIAVNEAFGKACGLKPEEIVGKADLDVWPRELAERYCADDQEVMNSGKRKCVDEPLNDKEGRILWIETIKTPVYNDEGEIIGTTGIARDITERKKYEERLLEVRKELEIRVKVRTAELSKVNEDLTKYHNQLKDLVKDRTSALEKELSLRKEAEIELNKYKNHLEELVKKRTDDLLKEVTGHKEAQNKIIKLAEDLSNSNKKLNQLALIDSHTGLYNHRYLEEAIEAEFHRARRYAQSLAIIMLDIDYFKSINDVYGHQFGDFVLQQFAQQIRKMVRRYDIVVRFGGEEFIIVSPGMDRDQVLSFSQRILEALNLYNFGNKKHVVKLKVSIGAVSYPEDRTKSGMDMVNLADQVLSKAKESGGNRIYLVTDIKKINVVSANGHNKAWDVKALKGKIDKLNKKANQSLTEAILAFAKTIELKDHYTGKHVEITGHYVTMIANRLGLPKEEVELIRQASILHDLGKLGISEKILLKKSKLTKKEFEEIKKHPQIGADVLRPIHFLRGLIPIIFYHHERWDGKGYPSCIRGEEIPIGARIMALADVYQALTSDRPYRKAY